MPVGLHIITSNQMEILASGLAELLCADSEIRGAYALRPEIVMVQSKGMQRWVSMAIARQNGICANLEFPFPNSFLEKLYVSLVGPLPEVNPYESQALAFRILHVLPELIEHEAFTPLRQYLALDQRPLKRYQLARKIADIFDQYAVFRPDLLLAWESDSSKGDQNADMLWQATLWRHLVGHNQSPHRSVLQKKLVHLLKDSRHAIDPGVLPDRVCVFGISHLPPFHLQALDALSQRIPVYLFLLNPCRHYWSDILSDHQMTRLRAGYDLRQTQVEQLHLERGNRLLASLGYLGKQFIDLVYQNPGATTEAFVDTATDSLLARIQQDILDLVDRPGPMEPLDARMPVADGSLRIHCCHSPMREVEVLYDQILDMLGHDKAIHPLDILVMTPNIGMYAPYIHAVFGTVGNRQIKIPYTVADQNILSQAAAVEGFLNLLGLVGSRFEASRVIGLLECPPVHKRFGFSSEDLVTVERWIRATGIQWGWDGTDRKRHHLPGFKENTWRMGLDRLVLGYAMAPEHDRLFADILPFDGIGAGEGAILGPLMSFAEALHDALEGLLPPATPAGWHERLNQLVDRFFLIDEQSEREIQFLHGAFQILDQIDRLECANQLISFEVVRGYLTDHLSHTTFDSGFISGGVTFCAMLPMRSIPAQVICLLGMNHDTFPRDQQEPGFNLIAAEPRNGDRSKRNDDRYLFLETLISARKFFYLSYVGRDIQDNSSIPPSVLVDELVEYAVEGFGIRYDQLVAVHPLHGFSPSYFDGRQSKLFSYSNENKEAAAQLSTPGQKQLFFTQPLAPPDSHWRRCQWNDAANFFFNPARYLLERRLGIWLRDSSDTISDRESFVLDALQRYQVSQHLLGTFLHDRSQGQTYDAVRAGGYLPHGTVGRVIFEELNNEVQEYIGKLDNYLAEDQAQTMNIEVELPPFFMHGIIEGIYPKARIVYRLGKMRSKDLMDAFIHHLALALSTSSDLPEQTFLICKDAIWQFRRVEAPGLILKRYLELYWMGMQSPLPFFSRTSFEYAQQILTKKRSRKEALAAAKTKWQGNDFYPGESENPYLRRCFGDSDVWSADFEQISLDVYSPILAAGSRITTGGA